MAAMAAATEARAAAGEGATAEAPMVAQAAAVVAKLPPELRFLKAASSSRPRLALSTAPALLREPLGMVLVRLGRSHGGEIWSQALGVELEWEQLQLRRTRTAFFTSFSGHRTWTYRLN
jgi:hypothetical protein